MEKISVIVPVYNGELTVEKCIRSILTSTCDTYSLEVIVVNNGSTDGTLSIVTKIAEDDNRVKVFSQENQGPAGSRNTGLDKASGEYVTFCDSDDWVEPQWIESMLNNIRKYNAEMACCQPYRVYNVDNNECWGGRRLIQKYGQEMSQLKLFWIIKFLMDAYF